MHALAIERAHAVKYIATVRYNLPTQSVGALAVSFSVYAEDVTGMIVDTEIGSEFILETIVSSAEFDRYITLDRLSRTAFYSTL